VVRSVLIFFATSNANNEFSAVLTESDISLIRVFGARQNSGWAILPVIAASDVGYDQECFRLLNGGQKCF